MVAGAWPEGSAAGPIATAAVEELEESESEPGALPGSWRPETVAWHAAVLEDWELGPCEVQLLRAAGECLNLAAECQDVIVRDGLTVPYGAHRKAHPLLQTANAARAQFLTLLVQLGLTK